MKKMVILVPNRQKKMRIGVMPTKSEHSKILYTRKLKHKGKKDD